MLVTCPSCSRKVDEDAPSCPGCGKKDPGREHRAWEETKLMSLEARDAGRADALAGRPPREPPAGLHPVDAKLWRTVYNVGRNAVLDPEQPDRPRRSRQKSGGPGSLILFVAGSVGLIALAMSGAVQGIGVVLLLLGGIVFGISALIALFELLRG